MADTKSKKRPAPSRNQLILAGLFGLVAAYVFASLAIDQGNLAYYVLTLISLYAGIRYLARAFIQSKKKNE